MDNQLHKAESHFWGAGWAFPVQFSAGNYQLATTRYEENINDSIRLILSTQQGERCMEPQFGSGLHRFFFRKMDATLKADMRDAIKNALLENEPRIRVMDVRVNFEDIATGHIRIEITYEYKQTNTRHNYVYPFYLKEGTNLGT